MTINTKIVFKKWLWLCLTALTFMAGHAQAQLAYVDLLVLYDDHSKNYFSGEPEIAMQEWVNQINAAYWDSKVAIRLRLVGVYPADIEGNDMRNVLWTLRNDKAARKLRNQMGADIVTLLHHSGNCGIGYVGTEEYAGWNVISPNCSTAMTMAHELGHNMGLEHSRRQNPGYRSYPYAVGFGVDNQFATIMAYPHLFGTTWVNRFSNPTIQCRGYSCGVPEGEPDSAYAALALNQSRAKIAQYRPSPAEVSRHCSGTPEYNHTVGLPVGMFTTSQLRRFGINDNDISSLNVQKGYTIYLFEHDNFVGPWIRRTSADNCLHHFNDKTSSIFIIGNTTIDPITVQAENFEISDGVTVETTMDEGGGQNVTSIDTNDWMVLPSIKIPEPGSYYIEFRVASTNGGRLSLELFGDMVDELVIPSTGSMQTWTTFGYTTNLVPGSLSLGLLATAGGWNLNWVRVTHVN